MKNKEILEKIPLKLNMDYKYFSLDYWRNNQIKENKFSQQREYEQIKRSYLNTGLEYNEPFILQEYDVIDSIYKTYKKLIDLYLGKVVYFSYSDRMNNTYLKGYCKVMDYLINDGGYLCFRIKYIDYKGCIGDWSIRPENIELSWDDLKIFIKTIKNRIFNLFLKS